MENLKLVENGKTIEVEVSYNPRHWQAYCARVIGGLRFEIKIHPLKMENLIAKNLPAPEYKICSYSEDFHEAVEELISEINSVAKLNKFNLNATRIEVKGFYDHNRAFNN
ncbi:MAG: hypothetical protein ACPHSD_18440 [Candidatus Latescibacterota bacterium]|jgi:hypothetical protein